MRGLWILLLMPGLAFAWGDSDKYCLGADVKKGICKKGDLIRVVGAAGPLLFCDFTKSMHSVPVGKNGQISGFTYCHYRGNERENRNEKKPQ